MYTDTLKTNHCDQEIDNGDEKRSNMLEQFREENQFNILIAKDILYYFNRDSMIF